MIEKIILNEQIISKVKSTFEGKTGTAFISRRFSEHLEKYWDENKGRINCHFKNDQFPDPSTIEDALECKKPNGGATDVLRNLLCRYAFENEYEFKYGDKCKNDYEFTIKHILKLSLDDEKQKSEKTRGEKKPKLEDVFHSEFGGLKNDLFSQHEEVLKAFRDVDELYKDNAAMNRAEKEYFVAKAELDIENLNLEPLKNAIRQLLKLQRKRIHAVITFDAYFTQELMMILIQEKKYSEVLELVEQSLKWNPDFPATNSYIANAYIGSGEYEMALSHLEKVLKIYPLNTETLLMKIYCYYSQGDKNKVIELGEEIIAAFKEDKLYSVDLALEENTTTEKQTPNLTAYLEILKICIMNLYESNQYILALAYINDSLNLKIDLMLLSLKLNILANDSPYKTIELSGELAEKYPEHLPFMQFYIKGLALTDRRREFLKHCPIFLRRSEDKEKAKQFLLTESAFKQFWNSRDFQKILNDY